MIFGLYRLNSKNPLAGLRLMMPFGGSAFDFSQIGNRRGYVLFCNGRIIPDFMRIVKHKTFSFDNEQNSFIILLRQ